MNTNVGGENLLRLKEKDEYGRMRWKEGWSEYIEYKKKLTRVNWRSDMQNYVEWPKNHKNGQLSRK